MSATPDECALSGFSSTSEARVVARHQVGKYAVLYVHINASPGFGDIIVFVEEHGGAWHELSSGSADWTWIALPESDVDLDGEEIGLLGLVGDLPSRGTVIVELDGATTEAQATECYWAALFVGVDPDALDRVRLGDGRQ